ncbi:hypothetical protein [Nitrosomonas communis]|uniref:hypothetical protein n=1 Tax=Nitrosomonas communis TaxID=44574 RepID=UPI0026F140ED|nr:hypothetical protein [Nitrosomonas communis]MCO6426582.1 hypothetical protein [Nitrosomonas communis]
MKALFFLRHYNDIDHITPVIAKWIERGHVCDIVMIGKKRFDGDYRIEFLKKLAGVSIVHLQDLLSFLEFTKWRLQTLLLVRSSYRSFFAPLVKVLARIYNAKRREAIWLLTTQRLLERSFPESGKGVVAFDWIERNSEICVEWVEILVSVARKQGLGTVSLPHGDSPHASQLIRRGEWQLKPDTSFSAAGMFDKVVVPNELCATRFRPFMDDRKLIVLGSPRYCEEWLTKLATLIPASPLVRSDNRLNVVIFLRKANFTTFWEEVGEVIQMIAAFPGVELAVKPHTRGGWKQSLTKDAALQRLTNVTMIEEDIHSVHLLQWADVIIDLATSVAYEAIRAGKPVLAADYLHAGRSAAAVYMPETELRCRDDVYENIDKLLTKGCQSHYIESHRQRFIKEMLDVPGKEVLPHYVALLESLVETR